MKTKHANTDARLALLSALVAAALAGCSKEVPAPAPAPAPTASAPAPAPAPAGPIVAPATISEPTDAQRSTGATIAAQGSNGAPACNSCHGAKGEGNAAGGFPRIAGQSHAYLVHELESFVNGSHKSSTMTPIATALSADQRIAVAAYFASLAPDGSGAAEAAAGAASGAASNAAVAGGTGAVAAASSKGSDGRGAKQKATASNGRGATLATVGDNAKGVQACANCHGPGGIGTGRFYPYLAGQYAAYLTNTLGDWRSGARTDDPSGQMPIIAKSLDEHDIAAVAAYYGAQPPRSTPIDAERMGAIGPLAAASAPAVTSGPRQAAAPEGASPAAGTGTEQGAPTTGGGQGPGGGGGTSSASTGAPQGGARGAATAASGSTPAASSR